jgi:hypothetical protein
LNHDDSSAPRDLRKVLDEIETHPGTLAKREWDALTHVHAILLGNERDLLDMIEAIEQNADGLAIIMTSNLGDPLPKMGIYRELLRKVHNYGAAVGTLIDHTRNLLRDYAGTPTAEEYAAKLNEMKANGITPFMSKFRNYLVHFKIPPVGVNITFSNSNGMVVTVFINRDQALQWDKWPAAARAFLADQPKQVNLRLLVEQYAALLETLYRWLYDQFPNLHGAEVDAVNELIKQTPAYRLPDGSPGEPA